MTAAVEQSREALMFAVAKRLRVRSYVEDFYRAFATARAFGRSSISLGDFLSRTELSVRFGDRAAFMPYSELPLAVLAIAFQITWRDDEEFGARDYCRVRVLRLSDCSVVEIHLKARAPDPQEYDRCASRVRRAVAAVIETEEA